MRNLFVILFICLGFPIVLFSESLQNVGVSQAYIDNFKDDAIKEMQMYNIPASITLAQGMLESGNGTSDLAIHANNHFGIKCHDEWTGETYIMNDDEKNECFRKYKSVLESYTDHSLFLKSRARYASLFELNHTDYKGWANGLKDAGYATDPNYTKRLLDLIEAYELYKYDIGSHTSRRHRISQEKHTAKNKTSNQKSKSTAAAAAKQKQSIKSNTPVSVEQREILREGIVKYVIIKPSDTFYKISKETDKDLWQLYKYNDMTKDEKLFPGRRLYLQPKRRKAKEAFHTVKKGETMKSISQDYCIKLKQLYKKNNMHPGEEPSVGEVLNMRSRKK